MKSLKILIAWLLIIGQPGVLFCDYVMMVLFAGTGNSKVFQMDDNGVISHQYDLILTDRNEPMELCFSPDGRWGLVGYDMTQSKPETHITTVLGINNDRIIHVQETIPNSFDKLVAISPDSKYGVYGQNLNTLRYYSDRTFEDIPTDNDYLAGLYADFSSYSGNLITDSGWPGGEVREFTLLENGKTTTTGVIVDISPATAFQGVYVSPDGKYAVIAGVLLGTTYFCVVEINKDGTLSYLPEKDFEYPGLINKFAFVPPYKGEGTSFMVY